MFILSNTHSVFVGLMSLQTTSKFRNISKIEERAKVAAWQIFEEIGLSEHSVDRVSEIIEEKMSEQKAIDIDIASIILCRYVCTHKIDPNKCLNSKCKE